jgi:hypothetical protein
MIEKLKNMALETSVAYEMDKENIQRKTRIAGLAQIGLVLGISLLSTGADAASLRDTATSIFTVLYGIVGVAGAIAVVVTGINWGWGNFMGSGDPKRLFFSAILGTAIGLGAVTIIQWIKEAVGGTADVSSI